MTIYVVRPGDTMFLLAQRFGVPLERLIEVNRLPDPDRLAVGQALIIPQPPPEPLRYTVRRGDTLFALARLFGTTVEALVRVNRIPDPNLIFPGQVLVIPGFQAMRYTVRSGDTLFLIARRFGTTVEALVRLNAIPDPDRIFPGQVLVVPQPLPVKPAIFTNGFFFPLAETTVRRVLGEVGPFLTFVSVFEFRVDGRGGLLMPPRSIAPLLTVAREQNVAPLATVTNVDGGTFNSELARAVMSDPAVRDATIARTLELLRANHFTGVVVDFENMFPEDRPLYNDFIRALADAVRPEGFLVSLAMAPKYADFPHAPWIGTFDYATLGSIADFVIIMTYEWGWVGGPPRAISPANLVRRVLEYAVSLIPPGKILQGMNLYGYDWELPDTPENLAQTVSPQDALRLAIRYGSNINFDEVAQSPWFEYVNELGVLHQVWFEDPRSLVAKYGLTREFGLLGVSYWNLLQDFPQNWVVLDELFTIRKVAA
ncbi:MAG: LysM peptidoglycan-binding domain-containing protein [Bacillota bacterium]|nr:LysM peptidoglycan-binding domain-containing protein [Bacillota bacterium]